MFLPLYILVAVVNIVAKHNNYYIKTPRNPDFDVRVRRDAPDRDKSIDFNGVTELKKGENAKEGISLKESIKIYIEDDENVESLKKIKEDNSVKLDATSDSGEVTELKGNEKVLSDIASVIDDLKVLLSEYNDNDEKNTKYANTRVRRDLESTKTIEGDVNSDIAELEKNSKLWKETTIKDIENLWNNISSEFDRLGKLMSQYETIEVNSSKNIDTKVKREIGNVKIITNDDKINDKIVGSKNNAKVWKEITSVVAKVKDYIGKNPIVINRVSRGRAKVKDSDLKTSAEDTVTINQNAKGLEEMVPILSGIKELISEYKRTVKDETKKPDSRVKREAKKYKLKYPGAGVWDTLLGSLVGQNEIIIGNEIAEMENRGKEAKYISPAVKKGNKTTPMNKYVGELFPKETHIKKILSTTENPLREISPQKLEIKDVLLEKNEVVPWPKKLVQASSNEKGENEKIMKDDVLKEHEAKNIPKQDKKAEEIFRKEVKENLILLNEDEGTFEERQISKENDVATPRDLTQSFGIKRKNDGRNGNQIINIKDDREDSINLKIDDDIQTLKILNAFDDIDDLLEVHILENSVEEEKVVDKKGVQSHTKSVQVHQLIVDYTNSHELKDVENPEIVRTRDDHIEENRLKQVSRNDGEEEQSKRITLMKILKGPTVLNKSRIKRKASPENSVTKFFSNIYNKVYDMTHAKKEKDVDNNLLLSDDNYNSYDSLYQPNIINNQNSGNNQYEHNHIIDNSLTHSDYTHNSNYDNDKPIYNSATNTNQYGYGYNIPTNGLTHSDYIYNNNYGYDKAIDKPPLNGNMYGFGYNAPTNDINTNIPTYNYNYASVNNHNQPISNGLTYSPNGYPYNPDSGYSDNNRNGNNFNNINNNTPDYKYNYGSGYGDNTTSNNVYGYNSTQDYGYRYNTTMAIELNKNGNSTEATIVPGCIFCSNFGCQKNYRWMGVACVPIKG